VKWLTVIEMGDPERVVEHLVAIRALEIDEADRV
jgi:hypothetical protein